MVQFWCVVCGDGTVLSVTIRRNATVRALQQSIFLQKRYHLRAAFEARDLLLCVAREPNGEWIAYDEALDARLRRGLDMSRYRQMLPARKLNDVEYFGATASLSNETIHVLVVWPPTAPPPDESHRLAPPRKRTFDLAGLGPRDGQQLLDDLNIRMEDEPMSPLSRSDETQPTLAFQWDSIREDQQHHTNEVRERYRTYVEGHLETALKATRLYVASVPEDLQVLIDSSG